MRTVWRMPEDGTAGAMKKPGASGEGRAGEEGRNGSGYLSKVAVRELMKPFPVMSTK